MNAFVLPYAPSETRGFFPERLERLTAVMQREIDEKKAPGLVDADRPTRQVRLPAKPGQACVRTARR